MIFGGSTAASAAVVAVFMGGLGVGGWVIGRYTDRATNALRLYALLEGLVALTAAATPTLLGLVQGVYVRLGGTAALGSVGATALHLALAGLVLLPPTFFAGGTLGAAARSVEGEGDRRRRGTALLYGVNTLGAVAGSVAATFWLLERLGTQATLWVAALANVSIAVVAATISRERTGASPTPMDETGLSERASGRAGRARADRLRRRGLCVLPDGARLVPDVRSDPRGDRLHLRPRARGRPRRRRAGRAALRGPVHDAPRHAHGVRRHVPARVRDDRPALRRSATAWPCWPPASARRREAPSRAICPVGRGSRPSWCSRRRSWPAPSFRFSSRSSAGADADRPAHRERLPVEHDRRHRWARLGGGFGLLPLLTAPGCWRGVSILLAAPRAHRPPGRSTAGREAGPLR